ncbi:MULTISPECIES: hypothetical protein [Streptomyces]|uniref:Uncharacterized protein n=1 Tax=Streptomyces lycii TaxID=2654337 RepID=A0ABQ7FDC2_9ACTN|nr:hypothetical protein [Streptomyces lycii]KAF4406660.1 hypothetical protein GCU69_23855 [Streptomyces lycii]
MEWTDPKYRRMAEALRRAQAEADRRTLGTMAPRVTVRGFLYPAPGPDPAGKPTT